VRVESSEGKTVLGDLPPNITRIVLFKSPEAVSELDPGDLCVVESDRGPPRAFFRWQKVDAPDSEEDLDLVIAALRGAADQPAVTRAKPAFSPGFWKASKA
jgi:hypothetical protein